MSAPDPETLDGIRARGEAFLEAVSREYHAAHAGLKKGADLQPIYAKHAAAYDDATFDTVRDWFRRAPADALERRSARMLLEWLAESRAGQKLAPVEEKEIAWEGAATIKLPDGSLEPYQRAPITIANTKDAKARRVLDDARATLVMAELAPMKEERLQREKDIVEGMKIAASYNATFENLSGLPLMALREECERFLADTRDMWHEVLPEFLKARLAIPVADATRADALALFRASEFDGAFPGDAMEREVRRCMGEMGASADAGGRVKYDTGEREGKRSRAFCAPVRIPDEVHLVLRPHGGQNDWQTLLHELGHALHFGNMDRSHPFEYRWLGDNSITEGYAMLFDHRMQDAGWVRRYTGVGANDQRRFLRSAGFEELHFLRRYCGKLIYETQLYGGSVKWAALPDLYVETLGDATNFRYQRADAFVDVDPRFYSARYLRAWQLQSLLNESLRERFDEDWWRNPRAGPWIVAELFGHGQRELAEEQAQRVSNRSLSFAPLVRAIEKMLN